MKNHTYFTLLLAALLIMAGLAACNLRNLCPNLHFDTLSYVTLYSQLPF